MGDGRSVSGSRRREGLGASEVDRAYGKWRGRLSPEGRGLWEELELLAESAPELESRMARENEVSERIFDLPVSEQGVLARLAQLLSGLREGDEAEVRGEPGRCTASAASSTPPGSKTVTTAAGRTST
jgi:hypothetical protein